MAPADLEDELDKIGLDQLHKAVLQLGGNCFELKKLCASLLISAGTLLAAFTGRQLDAALFVGAVLITLFFWVLDSQSYFYQEKLRAQMKKHAENLIRRGHARVSLPGESSSATEVPSLAIGGVGMPISEERENLDTATRARNALLNNSMFFYMALTALFVALAIFFGLGYIDTPPVEGG